MHAAAQMGVTVVYDGFPALMQPTPRWASAPAYACGRVMAQLRLQRWG